MYIGKVTWDRRKNVYDPNTGKRLQRMKDADKHITLDFPQYRILDQNIWEAAKTLQGVIRTQTRLQDQRRFSTLFTGLIRCGECGGGVHRHSRDKYVCFSAKDKGTCSNHLRVRISDLEHVLLYEIENKLMDPALCQVFCDEYTKHMNTVRAELVSERTSYEAELKKRKKEDERIIQLAMDGFADLGALKEKRNGVLARIAELEALLVETPEIPPLLHPNMGTHYRNKIQKIISQYREEDGREEVIPLLRSLVDKIVITPITGKLEISVDLYGDIAGILSVATGSSRSSEQVLNMAAQINTMTALDIGYQQENRMFGGAYHVGNLSDEIDGAGRGD